MNLYLVPVSKAGDDKPKNNKLGRGLLSGGLTAAGVGTMGSSALSQKARRHRFEQDVARHTAGVQRGLRASVVPGLRSAVDNGARQEALAAKHGKLARRARLGSRAAAGLGIAGAGAALGGGALLIRDRNRVRKSSDEGGPRKVIHIGDGLVLRLKKRASSQDDGPQTDDFAKSLYPGYAFGRF